MAVTPNAKISAHVIITVDDERKRSGTRSLDFMVHCRGPAADCPMLMAEQVEEEFAKYDITGEKWRAAKAASEQGMAAQAVDQSVHTQADTAD